MVPCLGLFRNVGRKMLESKKGQTMIIDALFVKLILKSLLNAKSKISGTKGSQTIVFGKSTFVEKTSKMESCDISGFQINCVEIEKGVCEFPQGISSKKVEKTFGKVVQEEIKGVTYNIPGGAQAGSASGCIGKF